MASREWLTCERCGDYRAVDPTALDAAREAISAAFGYRASFAHFPIVGLCPGCQSSLGGLELDVDRAGGGQHAVVLPQLAAQVVAAALVRVHPGLDDERRPDRRRRAQVELQPRR